MGLRFVNPRSPRQRADLSASQRRQLRAAGKLWDGQDLTARLRMESADPQERLSQFLQLWDIEQDGVHRYDAFFYATDSGTIFRRGTTEVVAQRIQFGFQMEVTAESLTYALRAANGERAPRAKKMVARRGPVKAR
jgi:hypothetical protein